METDWQQLKQNSKQRSEAIRQKYKDVFDRTDTALFQGDGALFSFLYSPAEYMTARVALKSPEAAMYILNIFAGANPMISSFLDKIKDKFKGLTDKIGVNAQRQPRYEGFLIASNNDLLEEGMLDSLKDMLQNKQLIQTIDNSPKAKEMKKFAVEAVKANLQDVVKSVKKQMNLKNTKKLDKLSDGKFQQEVMGRVPAEERQRTAGYVANQLKRAVKKFYIDKLKLEMKELPEGLRKYYTTTIKHIKSM